MEILDLYDDTGNKLTKTIKRGDKPPKGANILLSVVFIKNKEGKYLIQKSSLEKGGEYTTTGGHVTHNENDLTTIAREINEEIGLTVNELDLKHIITFKYPNRYCLFSVYLYEIDNLDITKLSLQEEEVDEVIWLTKEEIVNLINNRLFLESHGYIFTNYIV